jgi:4-hydroxy-2-oxoheptanedioate aldolase
VDIIVPAQFDLSTALGVSGQSGQPDLVAAVTRIERAALDTALPLGGVALTPLGESGGAAQLEEPSARAAALLVEVV